MATFMKFTIVAQKDAHSMGDEAETVLLNLDQIVSIKPIKFVFSGEQKQGYWLRMTNGKKYRATGIPKEIQTLFSQERKS